MLYELRKYTLKVGTMATVLELYGTKGYPAFSAEEKARWQEATAPVIAAWITGMRERNIDGAALVEEARALVARYGQGVA